MASNQNSSSDLPHDIGPAFSTLWTAAALLLIYGTAFALALLGEARTSMGHLQFLATSSGLALTLITLSVIDVEQLRLPNVITLPMIAAGLLLTYATAPGSILDHVLAAAAGYATLAAIASLYRYARGIDGLGLGDAKLYAAAGAWLGLAALPTVLLLATAAGLASAFAILKSGVPITGRTRLPFGPCLAVAFWIVWLWGPMSTWF